jgi:hypothetical protein
MNGGRATTTANNKTTGGPDKPKMKTKITKTG